MISFHWLETGLKPAEEYPTKAWLLDVIEAEGFKAVEITYVICSDEYLLQLNRQFLAHDDYTDILTFPLGMSEDTLAGEIYISSERVVENASLFQTEPSSELLRVMVHGLLHLAGYDDHTQQQKAAMRAKEDYYLNLHP